MKKILAVFFLLICSLVTLLAIVDLEPYLAPDQPDLPKTVSLPLEPGSKTPPIKTDSTGQAETKLPVILTPENTKQADPFDYNAAQGHMGEIITGKKSSTASSSPARVDDNLVVIGAKPLPSSPIKLEVTILPVGEYPFSILLETFTEEATAQKAIPYYQERGISSHWVKVDLGEDGIRYRLFTGEFATTPEAQQYLDQKKLVDKPIKLTYYAARIGIYQDKEHLANAFVKTSETGVLPYILGTKNGDYFLYAGAFYTFLGATAQCQQLTEAGLSCEPVKRSTILPH